MQLIKKDIDPHTGKGAVTLRPQFKEDMWNVYNLLARGDVLTAGTFRKVQKVSNTGTTSSTRKKLNLTVEVTKIDFEPKAGKVRVSGKVLTETPEIKRGAFHTIELDPTRKFTLHKEEWDSLALDLLKEACDAKATADLAAVVMEMGLAHVCLVSRNMTLVRAKIELSVPKKRAGSNQHDTKKERFFELILQAIQQHIDWNVVKAVVLASPGFVKDQFYEYLMAQAVKKDLQDILANKSRFVKARSSSGHKHSLREVLADESLMDSLKDVKAAAEVRALARFYDTFNEDSSKAVYGLKHVQAANEAGAIELLLMTNELFRVEDVSLRKMYVLLTQSVKGKGGEVHILSTMHPSGEQLKGLTGVAAVLRFPLDLSHLDEEDESSSTSSSSDFYDSVSSSDEEGGTAKGEEREMFGVLEGRGNNNNNNNFDDDD